MKSQAVIRLECEVRDDGSIRVHSPDLPLFHAIGLDAAEAQEITLEILKEHLQRNYDLAVHVRPAQTLESFLARREAVSAVPAHVIAEMAA